MSTSPTPWEGSLKPNLNLRLWLQNNETTVLRSGLRIESFKSRPPNKTLGGASTNQTLYAIVALNQGDSSSPQWLSNREFQQSTSPKPWEASSNQNLIYDPGLRTRRQKFSTVSLSSIVLKVDPPKRGGASSNQHFIRSWL